MAVAGNVGRPLTAVEAPEDAWIVCELSSFQLEDVDELQKTIPEKDVHFVSFTVDPEHDTPEVLRQYAQGYDADPARWHFLTGDKSALFDAAAGMKLTAAPAGTFGPEIVHAEKFLLVDGAGRVRGIYDSKDDEDLKKLAADATALADRQAGRLF